MLAEQVDVRRPAAGGRVEDHDRTDVHVRRGVDLLELEEGGVQRRERLRHVRPTDGGRTTSTEQRASWATRSETLPSARAPLRPRLPRTISDAPTVSGRGADADVRRPAAVDDDGLDADGGRQARELLGQRVTVDGSVGCGRDHGDPGVVLGGDGDGEPQRLAGLGLAVRGDEDRLGELHVARRPAREEDRDGRTVHRGGGRAAEDDARGARADAGAEHEQVVVRRATQQRVGGRCGVQGERLGVDADLAGLSPGVARGGLAVGVAQHRRRGGADADLVGHRQVADARARPADHRGLPGGLLACAGSVDSAEDRAEHRLMGRQRRRRAWSVEHGNLQCPGDEPPRDITIGRAGNRSSAHAGRHPHGLPHGDRSFPASSCGAAAMAAAPDER